MRRLRILPLLGGAIFLFCVWGFLELAEDYPEGHYRDFDEGMLRFFRTPEDPAIPRGPWWVRDAVRDVSALGSSVVLSITVAGTVGYLLLQRRWRAAGFVAFACGAGSLLNTGLKALAERPRPEIVPHLAQVTSSSFPSGHSMISAIVYLSVGVVLAQNTRGKGTGVYAVLFAVVLTLMIGCSRVYLGVHYPSDVLAGWAAGTAWALLCAAIQIYVKRDPVRGTTA